VEECNEAKHGGEAANENGEEGYHPESIEDRSG
jgi:hypothetical protein